jgi:hypothetical protein
MSLIRWSYCRCLCTNKGGLRELTVLFHSSQSALLKYWSFEPAVAKDGEIDTKKEAGGNANQKRAINVAETKEEAAVAKVQAKARQLAEEDTEGSTEESTEEEENIAPVKKLVPVIFFDEAHRLPLLIKDRKAMKCILDAMLVLTKQVRRSVANVPTI